MTFDPNAVDEPEAQYRLAFLTTDEAQAGGANATWFRVGDIPDLDGNSGIFRWVQRSGLAEHPSAYDTLNRLWTAVHKDEVVSFYEDDSTSINRVLEIFIRTNSGGTVLSKSDLLLSVATANFSEDARALVHGLVDDLNATGQGFRFSKDLVLKAGLIITDRARVGFVVEAFTPENVAVLEQQWHRVATGLRVAARLLSSFGFSDRTLSADSVMHPIADYVAFRGLDDRYVDSAVHREDRNRLRQWVIRTLLKQGVWGSGMDTLLSSLRRVVREHGAQRFPAEQLDEALAGG